MHFVIRDGTLALLVCIATLACSPTGSRATSSGSAPEPALPSSLAGEYHVAWDPSDGSLRIDGRFNSVAGTRFEMERGVAPYVRDLEAAAPLPAATVTTSWTAVARSGDGFEVPACAHGSCQLRYRFMLREAAVAFDSTDWAVAIGGLIVAPPSTWLLAPSAPQTGLRQALRLRFSVTTPPGQGFATGVRREPTTADQPATAAQWEFELKDRWTLPYSAFGPLQSQSLAVPGGSIELAIGPGPTVTSRDEIARWVQQSAAAVAVYWGRFPMPGALVLLTISPGARVGGGRTLSGGGGTVMLGIGERSSMARFRSDWVLVHELVHLGFPSVPRQQLWAQEGVATYVEPFARVRSGGLDERAAWRDLIEGLPQGLPQAGDRGLDHTPTWGRIYWGGALFWFLADLELRKRSANRIGLEHALRGILAAGGNNASHWGLKEVLEIGDRAVALPVLSPLYDAMKAAPYPVDLEAIWRQLGVAIVADKVIFDDAAPLASIRRSMTHGSDPRATP